MNKNNLLFCLILLIGTGCTNNSTSKQPETQQSTEEEEKILLGTIAPQDLHAPGYQEWFDPTYKAYQPDEKMMAQIGSGMENLNIKIFMGTWCSDSQREIPAFYRLLDDLKYDVSKVYMVGVDRTKELPEKELEGYDIEYVPTIIFYRGDKEIGRVIETPQTTLEQDILTMLE